MAPSETHVIGTTTCSAVDVPDSLASGRIDTRRLHRVVKASSACCRMISREHAPPTNPSMRPSANTIARSPRWADTGARRATTVATANDCPSRRRLAICSKNSMAFISTDVGRHSIRQPLEQTRGARRERLEPAGKLPLELDRDEPRRPDIAPPFILEQAVQQRERLIITPARFVRQPFQKSPLEPLFR